MEYYGTIGPACADEEVLRRMFRAGMTGVRMNLSHGGLAEHRDWLERIARAAEGRPYRLLIDLQGPEVRIGRLPTPLVLKNRQAVTLGQGGIPIPETLTGLAKPGQTLLLDDGKLELTVTGGRPGALFCTVVRGGKLESRKSLAAPGLDLHLPTLTDEDEENLSLAGACGVTGVMPGALFCTVVRGGKIWSTCGRPCTGPGPMGCAFWPRSRAGRAPSIWKACSARRMRLSSPGAIWATPWTCGGCPGCSGAWRRPAAGRVCRLWW